MSSEGALTITLDCTGSIVERVHIQSSRPMHVAKVLIGKSPEQCLSTVRLLFHVCGNAQALASLLALRQAMGIAAEPAAEQARQLLVQMETAREHAMRVLMDWPRFLDKTPGGLRSAELLQFDRNAKALLFEQGDVFSLNARLAVREREIGGLIERLETFLDEMLFAGGMRDWQVLETEAQLLKWLDHNQSLPAALIADLYRRNWQGIGQNAIAALPGVEDESLLSSLAHDDFSRTPCWSGRCHETGPLARQQAHPLLSDLGKCYRNGLICRLAARLSELAGIPSRLKELLESLRGTSNGDDWVGAARPWGIAQVQAARGLLIHGVVLEQGMVADYRIVAPTEWNFHPQGVVAESLMQLQSEYSDVLKRQAELLINAVDPCVQYRIGISANRQE